MKLGNVVLTTVLFHQREGAKLRPAVVVLDSLDDDFVAAPVTSRERRSQFDVAIVDWSGAGLNVPSWIRADKLAVLPKAGIIRNLGELLEVDCKSLETALCNAYCRK